MSCMRYPNEDRERDGGHTTTQKKVTPDFEGGGSYHLPEILNSGLCYLNIIYVNPMRCRQFRRPTEPTFPCFFEEKYIFICERDIIEEVLKWKLV